MRQATATAQQAVDSLMMKLLHLRWRLPHGFLTKSVTTLLPVDFAMTPSLPRYFHPKASGTSVGYPQVKLRRLALSCGKRSLVQTTRFNRHTFCLNSNTVRSFHVCTVGENMPLKRLDSAIDHNNHPVILLKSYFSTAIAIPLLSSLWEERLILNCSRMFHA